MFTDFSRMNVNDNHGAEGDGGRLGPDGEPAPRTDEEYSASQLTLRAIVSSKEAGVIIGKAGKNVADLREETGVKAGVSKVVQGVHDRVLTVTGSLDGVAKAYAIVAKGLLEGAPMVGMGGVVPNNGTHRKLLHCLFIANSYFFFPRRVRLYLDIARQSAAYYPPTAHEDPILSVPF